MAYGRCGYVVKKYFTIQQSRNLVVIEQERQCLLLKWPDIRPQEEDIPNLYHLPYFKRCDYDFHLLLVQRLSFFCFDAIGQMVHEVSGCRSFHSVMMLVTGLTSSAALFDYWLIFLSCWQHFRRQQTIVMMPTWLAMSFPTLKTILAQLGLLAIIAFVFLFSFTRSSRRASENHCGFYYPLVISVLDLARLRGYQAMLITAGWELHLDDWRLHLIWEPTRAFTMKHL